MSDKQQGGVESPFNPASGYVDLQRLHDKLTEGFIHYQWHLDHPTLGEVKTEELLARYRVDMGFNQKVQGLVSGVMQIVQDHLST